jgi:hypothetical protein
MTAAALSVSENPLINGCMDASGDTTSLTAAGKILAMYEVLDLGTSGAATISQQAITTAPWNSTDKLPRDIRKFLRWAQTTGGTTTHPELDIKIPDVQTFAGKMVTFQGFYRSNTAFDVLLRQNFGAGGSPTADIDTAKQTLPSTVDSAGTAQWLPFMLTFRLGQMDGLTLGTTVNTSYLGACLQFPMSATFQVDLTDLRLVRGGERDVSPRRPVAVEEKLAQRFYFSTAVWAPVSTQSAAYIPFPGRMAAVPTMTTTGATSTVVTADGYALISAGAAAAITAIADARIAA